MRRKVSHFLVLVVVAAMTVGLMAGPASAKTTKMSAKQKAAIRAQLRKAVKKNPKVVQRKSFLKKASLVNFTLPITVKLRGYNAATNPNFATLDLGPSLGQREIDLGGSLAGEIQFHDSFDSGALGNVDLTLDESATKQLTSTSIPLLWNADVSNGGVPSAFHTWDTGLATHNAADGGCSTFTGTSALAFDPINVPFVLSGGAQTDPFANAVGVPELSALPTPAPNGAYVPQKPGIDSIDALVASKVPGNDNNLGGNPSPFPSGSTPTGFTQPPSVQDAVLRTTALKLGIAHPTTTVNQSTGAGPNGSQDITIGKSGGQANLFGNIPGKQYGIDVTVNLATQINSILRAVDPDSQNIIVGQPWPAALFGCRQAITGSVQNYIPGVRLKGNLKISPAITPSGDLRIAKATLSSLSSPVPTHIALAACLSPYSVLASELHSTDTTSYPVPDDAGAGLIADANLPANPLTARFGYPAASNYTNAGTCNQKDATHPTQLVQDAGFLGQAAATAAHGYSPSAVTSDGSKVSVAGDITVNNVSADIILGDR
jgi:hypothetical protein